jgi:hypothetical protein
VYLSTGVDKIYTRCALAVCLVVASKVKVDGFVLGHVLNLVTHVGYHTLLRSGIFGKYTRTHGRHFGMKFKGSAFGGALCIKETMGYSITSVFGVMFFTIFIRVARMPLLSL